MSAPSGWLLVATSSALIRAVPGNTASGMPMCDPITQLTVAMAALCIIQVGVP